MRSLPIFLISAALLLCAPVQADLRLTFSDTRAAEPAIISVKDRQVRMQSSGGFSLYDGVNDVIRVVDTDDDSYFELTRGEMQSRVSQMGGMMEQVREQLRARLAELPEDQRKVVEQQMTDLLATRSRRPVAPKVDWRDAGSEVEVAGYRCRNYTVSQDDQAIKEMCMASRQTLGISESDFGALSAMFAFLEEMAASAGRLTGNAQMSELGVLRALGGIPVQAQDLRNGQHSRLQSVSTATLSEDLFRIPGTFSRKDPFEGIAPR